MDLNEKVRELAQISLIDQSQFLVEVKMSANAGPRRVLVILDGDKGVTIEDCAKVSRSLAKALDEANVIDDHYTLEVTTPGLDHPLKLKRQYYKNVGRSLKVHTKDKALIQGSLAAVDEQRITLHQDVKVGKSTEQQTIEIPFENIDRAFVMVSFK